MSLNREDRLGTLDFDQTRELTPALPPEKSITAMSHLPLDIKAKSD